MYTHYWKRPVEIPHRVYDPMRWDMIRILGALPFRSPGAAYCGVPLKIFGPDGVSPLSLSDPENFAFNGDQQNNHDHESFVFDRIEDSLPQKSEEEVSCFCKTARKPYDLAVAACLIVAKHYLGDALRLKSDGDLDEENWPAAFVLAERVLGKDARGIEQARKDLKRKPVPSPEERLAALLANPNEKTWDDAFSLVIGEQFLTLWQAVLAIDPYFPRSKPLDESWPQVPDRQTIEQALVLGGKYNLLVVKGGI